MNPSVEEARMLQSVVWRRDISVLEGLEETAVAGTPRNNGHRRRSFVPPQPPLSQRRTFLGGIVSVSGKVEPHKTVPRP